MKKCSFRMDSSKHIGIKKEASCFSKNGITTLNEMFAYSIPKQSEVPEFVVCDGDFVMRKHEVANKVGKYFPLELLSLVGVLKTKWENGKLLEANVLFMIPYRFDIPAKKVNMHAVIVGNSYAVLSELCKARGYNIISEE